MTIADNQPSVEPAVLEEVRNAAQRATAAAPSVRTSSDMARDEALVAIADHLEVRSAAILDANRGDVEQATTSGLSRGLLDRLRLDPDRLAAMADQIRSMAKLPPIERVAARTVLPTGQALEERRIPVGVIGANYEARANVTLDIATQIIKSGNAGVLRTGSAALRTAQAIVDEAIAPSLRHSGIDHDAIQLVSVGDRSAAYALVSLPSLIPLVILRGSGATTRSLARTAAEFGVLGLAHADGGGTIYVHAEADRDKALTMVPASVDRLGVCNRLNLLLIDRTVWDDYIEAMTGALASVSVDVSLPPHDHPLGYEWATDDEREATVTIAPVDGPDDALRVIHEETPGLAATIVTENQTTAGEFIDRCSGTGAFWNVSTRLLDGFRLTGAPETGIAVHRQPGPRGPVTYRDLFMRQYVLTESPDVAD